VLADEAALLERLRAGDEQAFERLVREHSPRMLAVARRMLRSEHDALDAVQDAFLSAWKALDGFEGGARLGTWLHRIVVNAALMKLRTARRRKDEVSVEDLLPRFGEDGHVLDPPSGWKVTAEAIAQDKELRVVVREAIDRLPDNYRGVLLARDIEGLDTKEAAEALGLSPNVVKTRLHRARQALRTLLNGHLAEHLQ
jgi:RNA polymerase sigma-70 factor (ECF subfamily)